MRAGIVLAAAIVATSAARAQPASSPDPASSPEPASPTVVGQHRFLFPSLQLSASTDASAKFRAAAGFVLGNTGRGTWVLWPRIESESSRGVTALFSSRDGESLPLQLGLVGTLSWPDAYRPENTDVERRAKIAVYDACAASCASDPKCPFKHGDDEDGKVRTSIKKLVDGKCSQAVELWEAYERALALRRSFPLFRISGGLSRVRQSFQFLTGGPGASELRTEQTQRMESFKLGLAGAYTWPAEAGQAWIVEARLAYADTASASSRTVRWCTPQGTIDGDASSTLELCKDRALGPPTQKQVSTVAVSIGAGETARQSYRWAVGAFANISHDKERSSIGLEVPFYLNLSSTGAPVGYAGDYKGLLRITPQVQWKKRDEATIEHTILLVVEVLGQRSFFRDALD